MLCDILLFQLLLFLFIFFTLGGKHASIVSTLFLQQIFSKLGVCMQVHTSWEQV